MVDNAQLLPRVVAGTQTHNGLEPSTLCSKGESGNQYTMIALRTRMSINLNCYLYPFIDLQSSTYYF